MFLGIEIGGTKLQIGIGPGNGRLKHLWRGDVRTEEGAEGIRAQLRKAVPKTLRDANVDRADLGGIGVGFGGPIDDATNSVLKSHQILGWDDFPLQNWLEQTFRLPVALGNDADVAGLAESRFGAGRGASPVFYITVGSGIGGGLIVDGKIYRGCGRGAAEIGHLRMTAVDPASGESFETDLENLASGWAIAELARRHATPDSLVWRRSKGRPHRITAESVGRAAADGDAFARRLIGAALGFLADAICHVIALLAPRRIVVGGGVALLGQSLFFQPLRRMVAERAFTILGKAAKIVPAALGESVVVHGALALARQRFASSPESKSKA